MQTSLAAIGRVKWHMALGTAGFILSMVALPRKALQFAVDFLDFGIRDTIRRRILSIDVAAADRWNLIAAVAKIKGKPCRP